MEYCSFVVVVGFGFDFGVEEVQREQLRYREGTRMVGFQCFLVLQEEFVDDRLLQFQRYFLSVAVMGVG